jgi:SAM-dependent methyltransferase
MKQNVYDNKTFSVAYDKMRKDDKGRNANDLVEIPNFRKLIPNVKEKKILDLGCGYGENDKYCRDLGAKEILGIDISEHMIKIAEKNNADENIKYKVMAMEDISKIKEKFDIVISSLAFHYVKDYEKLIKDIYNLLNDNGILIFSIDHPLRIASKFEPWMKKNYTEINGKWFLLVSDYNREGIREKEWNGVMVKKYHRNFSSLINGLVNSGFKIDKILEPIPDEESIKIIPKYINQYDRPYFLFIRAKK